MAKKEYTFNQGDLVTIKGMAGAHKVGHMVMVPIPTITRFKFELVEREMARFTYGKEPFCAWSSDLIRVKGKDRPL